MNISQKHYSLLIMYEKQRGQDIGYGILKLLLHKNYTTKDLMDCFDVSRRTFYNHLNYLIEQNFVKKYGKTVYFNGDYFSELDKTALIRFKGSDHAIDKELLIMDERLGAVGKISLKNNWINSQERSKG
jgi:hypothetical protein